MERPDPDRARLDAERRERRVEPLAHLVRGPLVEGDRRDVAGRRCRTRRARRSGRPASSSCRCPPARRTATGPGGAVAAARWSGASRASRSTRRMDATTRSRARHVSADHRVRSGRDPRARIALEAARQARRLPDEGRPRRRRLRRQGPEPRNRVRSYWQKGDTGRRGPPHPGVLDRIVDVEVTQTDSVSEALLLEANLIKRYRPRFNVRLKDDKSYPYIKVTLADDFPRVERTRKLVNDGSRYFGPYASAVERRRVDEPGPSALPVPDLHDRDQGRRAGAPAALPAVPHQALPGPVHRGDLEGRLPRRHRTGRAVPRGSPGVAGQGPPGRDGARRPSGPSTSGRPSCATRSGRSSGRWRARRWPPSPGPSSTWSAWPDRTTRPPSSCSSSATGR